MKKFLSLVLALMMVLSCTAALATVDVFVYDYATDDLTLVANSGLLYKEYTLGSGEVRVDAEIPAAIEALGGELYDINIYELSLGANQIVGDPIWWLGYADSIKNFDEDYTEIIDWSIEGSEVTYLAVVTWEIPNPDEDPEVEGDEYYYIDETQKFFVNSVDVNQMIISGEAWYPNNHANTFGPKIADSWKTYSVVDLSKDGTTALKLIGAGAWNIGNVFVTVKGDEVVVDYLMHEDIKTTDVHDDITVDSEYLNIFADAAAIDLKAESTFAFGVPFSIANDLGGDTTVALVVDMVVDYPSHSPFVYRFWPNLKANKAIVDAMNALLEADPVPSPVAE